MNVNVKEKLYTQIKDYCNINDIPIGDYINNLLQKAFMVDKYGEKPSVLEKHVKKETKSEVVETKQTEVEKEPDLEETATTSIKRSTDDNKEISIEIVKETLEAAEDNKEEEIKPQKRKLK